MLLAALCLALARTAGLGQLIHDVSRDYLSVTNPGPIWSYGWKPSLTGVFSPLTFHLVQPESENSGWEFWARGPGSPTSVYRNTGTETLTSDGGAGTYPPGSVWFGPGVEPSEDRFGVIRFTVPAGQGGRYRLKAEVRTRMDIGGSDADFHVLHNTRELFARNVVPVTSAGFTNDLDMAAGDTIDLLCGRGQDEREFGGGLKIAAIISRIEAPNPVLSPISLRVSQVELCWETDTNLTYQVEFRSLLTTNQWAPLFPGQLRGTGMRFCTNDLVVDGTPQRLYQVVARTNAPAQ